MIYSSNSDSIASSMLSSDKVNLGNKSRLYNSKRIKMRLITLRCRCLLTEISRLVIKVSKYSKNDGVFFLRGFLTGLLASCRSFSWAMINSSTRVANQPRSIFSMPSVWMQESRCSISWSRRSFTSAVCTTSGVLLRELTSTSRFDVRRLLLMYVSQRTNWGLTNRWVAACWSILPRRRRNFISERPVASVFFESESS